MGVFPLPATLLLAQMLATTMEAHVGIDADCEPGGFVSNTIDVDEVEGMHTSLLQRRDGQVAAHIASAAKHVPADLRQERLLVVLQNWRNTFIACLCVAAVLLIVAFYSSASPCVGDRLSATRARSTAPPGTTLENASTASSESSFLGRDAVKEISAAGPPIIGRTDDSLGEGSQNATEECQEPNTDIFNFKRKTLKFHVDAECTASVLSEIAKYLPHHRVRQCKTDSDQVSKQTVSSVYFDTEDLQLYQSKVTKQFGANLLRSRWYNADSNDAFIELKQRKDGPNEIGWKKRFKLREPLLTAFLRGECTPGEAVASMPELKRTTSDSPESALCISTRVHDMITEMKLRPILRTVCYRYAFQFPDTSDIRITLDTDLCFVREDGKVGSGWRRGDIHASGLPFSELGCDVVRYHSSILEIKCERGTPSWLEELLLAPGISAKVDVSKYVVGADFLFHDRVGALETPSVDVGALDAHSDSAGSTKAACDVEGRVPIRPAFQVKQDPKLLLANERTFLNWTGTVSMVMILGFGTLGNDPKGLHTKMILLCCCIPSLLYASGRFWYRRRSILKGDSSNIDDPIGPALVTCFIVLGFCTIARYQLTA